VIDYIVDDLYSYIVNCCIRCIVQSSAELDSGNRIAL